MKKRRSGCPVGRCDGVFFLIDEFCCGIGRLPDDVVVQAGVGEEVGEGGGVVAAFHAGQNAGVDVLRVFGGVPGLVAGAEDERRGHFFLIGEHAQRIGLGLWLHAQTDVHSEQLRAAGQQAAAVAAVAVVRRDAVDVAQDHQLPAAGDVQRVGEEIQKDGVFPLDRDIHAMEIRRAQAQVAGEADVIQYHVRKAAVDGLRDQAGEVGRRLRQIGVQPHAAVGVVQRYFGVVKIPYRQRGVAGQRGGIPETADIRRRAHAPRFQRLDRLPGVLHLVVAGSAARQRRGERDISLRVLELEQGSVAAALCQRIRDGVRAASGQLLRRKAQGPDGPFGGRVGGRDEMIRIARLSGDQHGGLCADKRQAERGHAQYGRQRLAPPGELLRGRAVFAEAVRAHVGGVFLREAVVALGADGPDPYPRRGVFHALAEDLPGFALLLRKPRRRARLPPCHAGRGLGLCGFRGGFLFHDG